MRHVQPDVCKSFICAHQRSLWVPEKSALVINDQTVSSVSEAQFNFSQVPLAAFLPITSHGSLQRPNPPT